MMVIANRFLCAACCALGVVLCAVLFTVLYTVTRLCFCSPLYFRNTYLITGLRSTDHLPGYAIGGLAGGEDKNLFWRVVRQCCEALPDSKPV